MTPKTKTGAEGQAFDLGVFVLGASEPVIKREWRVAKNAKIEGLTPTLRV
jgi:hypothetical protein